ncbi:hypothetical protein CHS0354_024129 [Potamilus streckersoni]|uniref:Glycogen phosphorylase n=1 Tax=Potamilus streckersoni TaxID=2493646 RepID=A0AAE0RZU8_9BIVA|nr:hypothetical protein CHS0354_024129 [Potamilus streckersoni]
MSKHTPKVAYFCMEYALKSEIKTYAGGLGILAGDYIKGAKDHDYPVIGIGIKWKQGYSEQHIDKFGKPYDAYRNYSYDNLEDTGAVVYVKIRENNVGCKVWKVKELPLYLLDTDFSDNPDNWITGQLYGWFGEERIAQEMVLGIGGVRALNALGIKPDVYHFNEGHAFFAGMELLRELMEHGNCFDDALKKVRSKIVFTTHTPIVQGNESHPISRIIYMGANIGLSIEQLVQIGGSPFNMTVAALRISKKSNAVAELHKETANEMWKDYPNCSEIIGITNAIHIPTWVKSDMLKNVDNPSALWEAHLKHKESLIDFVQTRTGTLLNKNKLLIGFSRRAVAYKRSDLIFQDDAQLAPLLTEGKIQIIFSGKSHPLDDADYDMEIGAMLTSGSDVWLNNPRRPQEASGTSGMKAAMNGVLNCSILDGWWPEACDHGVNGWQFGEGKGLNDFSPEELDNHDRRALVEVLTKEVLPTYYNNNSKWIEMMQESIRSTKEDFAIRRMLEEYFEYLYKA